MTPIAAPDTVCRATGRDRLLSAEHLASYVPTAARQVLVCCGDVSPLGSALKARGATRVFGLIDVSAGPAGREAGYDGLSQGPLDFLPLPEEPDAFDCIVCRFALERLRNPESFLQKLAERLAPGGLFLAMVPNMQYHKIVCALAEGRWNYGDSGVWDRRNLRFFTAREIRVLLAGAGLENARVASLVKDDGAEFPRDESGFVQAGRLRIGPLEDPVYPAWLTEYYVALAIRPEL